MHTIAQMWWLENNLRNPSLPSTLVRDSISQATLPKSPGILCPISPSEQLGLRCMVSCIHLTFSGIKAQVSSLAPQVLDSLSQLPSHPCLSVCLPASLPASQHACLFIHLCVCLEMGSFTSLESTSYKSLPLHSCCYRHTQSHPALHSWTLWIEHRPLCF